MGKTPVYDHALMQINPLPWSHLLDASVTTVVLSTSNETDDQLILANQPNVERAALLHAVPKRQVEFARGRHCLRQALQMIGYPPAIIPIGENRQPLSPTGALGSISHCENYVIAAAVRTGNFIGLGVDIEQHQPLALDIQSMVLTDHEKKHVQQLYKRKLSVIAPHWETIIFSIKESFYKALFATHPFYVDFLEANVHILDEKTFQIQPLVELSTLQQRSHIGYYAWDDNYIYSGLCIKNIALNLAVTH